MHHAMRLAMGPGSVTIGSVQTERYDLIVVGSGGGTKLARPAAALGMRVALVESGDFGGTCLNRGCIPSKMLIYPAEVAELAREAEHLGIGNIGQPLADPAAIVARITAAIGATSADIRDRHVRHPGLDLIEGHARFTADRTVRVGARALTAERLIIATGSRPLIPPIPGLADTPFMTSTEALRNPRWPRRLLVLGGGYIAAELGFAYRALGAEVALVARSTLLRHEDAEIAAEFTRVFARHHELHTHTAVEGVAHEGGMFHLRIRNADGRAATLTGDALLVATGIRPNTDDLGLEHTGVRQDANGFISVDDHLRTAVPGVYALGDCIGRHLFRHTVNYEGEYLMRTAVRRESDAPLDYGPVPHAVFSHPQVAGVGATEADLRAAGKAVLIGRATYADSTPGEARRCDHGVVKLLFAPADGRLLGAHIVGPEAATLIHLLIGMMKKNGTLDDLLDMIFIHPALAEVVRDAARDARDRRATDTPPTPRPPPLAARDAGRG